MNRAGGFALLAMLIAFAAVPSAAQQQYPSKPVRIIVGVVPGGSADAMGRIVAQILTERFKQNVIVDNRPGANFLIALQLLMNSSPDGYTLAVGTTGALTVSPAVEKNLPYNSLTSFSPVALAVAFPYILTARRDLPVNDIKGLIEYSKNHPGKMFFGGAGHLSVNHLGIEWLKSLTGLDAQHVPFKGSGEALIELIAGRLDFSLLNAGAAMPQIAAGKLKGLAVTSPARVPLAEGIPTMIESGVPGFAVQAWNGILGPAHLPRQIVVKLNEAINEGLQRSDTRGQLAKLILYPITDTPEGFQRLIAQELGNWREVVKRAKLQ
ncbi:MAG: tripartite tricarboxylate transporter substrate binding protein [Betaproteobacteria bacterium]|nr:tripartite tricarboxylate transporter substrate binding protein [Betaproteobacteria bacterium]